MAKLSNTPKQTLTFDLERRKSYTFRVALKYGDGLPVDLTGSQVTFVMKESALDDDPYDQLNQIVHSAAEIGDPASGVGVFFFQAAELDGPSGEYPYAITLISAEGFSTVVCKGTVNLLDNTEAMSMYRQYTGVSPSDELELTLRGGDVVNLQINSLSRDPSINSSWVDLDLLSGWQKVVGSPTPRLSTRRESRISVARLQVKPPTSSPRSSGCRWCFAPSEPSSLGHTGRKG